MIIKYKYTLIKFLDEKIYDFAFVNKYTLYNIYENKDALYEYKFLVNNIIKHN